MTVLHYSTRGIKFADGIKVANQLTLKQKEYPGLSRWAQCNYKSFLNVEEKGRRIRVRGMQHEKVLASFEDKKEVTSQGESEDAGKGKETDSPLEPSEEIHPYALF